MDYSGAGQMATVSLDPANFRYVDNEYKPLPAERVREAMSSGSPEDAFLVVAKRMPIRMRLLVDQRKLHRLLAEFGNSPLPVEIRQVRVNREAGLTSSGGGYDMAYSGGGDTMYESGGSDMYGMPGMEGGGYGSGGYGSGGYGSGGYGSGGYGSGESGTSDYGSGYEEGGEYGMPGFGYDTGYGGAGPRRGEVSSTTTYDLPVEVYGIIYIYNPVDRNKLGIEQTAGDQTGDLTGPVTTPAPGAAG
jgi:hypothetical protein